MAEMPVVQVLDLAAGIPEDLAGRGFLEASRLDGTLGDLGRHALERDVRGVWERSHALRDCNAAESLISVVDDKCPARPIRAPCGLKTALVHGATTTASWRPTPGKLDTLAQEDHAKTAGNSLRLCNRMPQDRTSHQGLRERLPRFRG